MLYSGKDGVKRYEWALFSGYKRVGTTVAAFEDELKGNSLEEIAQRIPSPPL